MKKLVIALSIVALSATLGLAQSDYSSRASYKIAKSPQSTIANIHKRQGIIVGHYIYSVDGLAASPTNGLLTIKQGLDNVYMPDNAIVSSNGYIDVTTAANPTTCTGSIWFGSSLVYSGTLGTASTYDIQIADQTKFTADSNLQIKFGSSVPTNALSVSVYVPYVLGN